MSRSIDCQWSRHILCLTPSECECRCHKVTCVDPDHGIGDHPCDEVLGRERAAQLRDTGAGEDTPANESVCDECGEVITERQDIEYVTLPDGEYVTYHTPAAHRDMGYLTQAERDAGLTMVWLSGKPQVVRLYRNERGY